MNENDVKLTKAEKKRAIVGMSMLMFWASSILGIFKAGTVVYFSFCMSVYAIIMLCINKRRRSKGKEQSTKKEMYDRLSPYGILIGGSVAFIVYLLIDIFKWESVRIWVSGINALMLVIWLWLWRALHETPDQWMMRKIYEAIRKGKK